MEKIRQLFRSEDPNSIKLAQKLCHELRLDYYVVLWKAFWMESKKPVAYYLDPPEINFTRNGIVKVVTIDRQEDDLRIYKIRLNGSIKVKQQHSQTSPDVW